MDHNPYAPPQTATSGPSGKPANRLTPGGLIFLGLGFIFFVLGVWAGTGIYQDGELNPSARWSMILGSVGMASLGVLLIIHGMMRRFVTLGAILFFMACCAATIVVAVNYLR